MKEFKYYTPTRVIFGAGSVEEIGKETRKLGTKVMIVTGAQSAKKFGLLQRTLGLLEKENCICEAFDKVEPDPPSEIVMRGAEICRTTNIEVIVALGGGSSIDTAKGIAVAATHRGDILDYTLQGKKGSKLITDRTLPVIAVPTTAGTGSEVTIGAVITNRKTRSKDVLFSPSIFPKVALVDPVLSSTMPVALTIHTGMDALCQSIEACVALGAQPITDALSLESIHLIGKGFRAAVADGQNLEARSSMSLGATLSGFAISYAGVGAVHALSMVLGGKYGISHGLGITILLPFVMEYNLLSRASRYAKITEVWGINTAGLSDGKAAERLIDEIYQLRTDFGVEQKLRDFNIKEQELSEIGKAACEHSDMTGNPRHPTPEEMVALLEKAY